MTVVENMFAGSESSAGLIRKEKKLFDFSVDPCTVMICLCVCASGSTAWERAVGASAPFFLDIPRERDGERSVSRSLVSSY